jgi:hypothetical protein
MKQTAIKYMGYKYMGDREDIIHEVYNWAEAYGVAFTDELVKEAQALSRIRKEETYKKKVKDIVEWLESTAKVEQAPFKAPHGNVIVDYCITVEVYPELETKTYKGRDRWAKVERRYNNQISSQGLQRAYKRVAPRVYITLEVNGKQARRYELEERGGREQWK